MNTLKSYLSILFVICYVFSMAVMAQEQSNLPKSLKDSVAPGINTTILSNLAETLREIVAPGTGTTGESNLVKTLKDFASVKK